MATYTGDDFEKDFLAAFQTMWAAAYPAPDTPELDVPNVNFDPALIATSQKEWVRLRFAPVAQRQLSHSGSPHSFQRSGTVVVEVNVEADTDTDRAHALAETIDDWLTSADGTAIGIFRNSSGPQVVGTVGAWYRLTLTATWDYFTDRPAASAA